MKLSAPGLENDVLRFEPFAEAHKRYLDHPDIAEHMWRWMPKLPGGSGVEQYADYILAQQKTGNMVGFTMYRKSDEAFAGVMGLTDISRINRSLRVAYGWHPPNMHGTAVFPAAQALMLQRALDWGMRRICWYIDSGNTDVLAAVEWVGARREAVCRSLMRLADGNWSDMIVLSLLRSEAHQTVERMQDVIAGKSPMLAVAR